MASVIATPSIPKAREPMTPRRRSPFSYDLALPAYHPPAGSDASPCGLVNYSLSIGIVKSIL